MVPLFSHLAICCDSGFFLFQSTPSAILWRSPAQLFHQCQQKSRPQGQAGAEIQNCHMLSNIVLCLPVFGEGRRQESAAQPASEDVGTLQDSKWGAWSSYCYCYCELTSGCGSARCLLCCPQRQQSCHLLLADHTAPALRGVMSEARFEKQSKLGQKKNNEQGCQNTVKDHVMALSAYLKPRKAEKLIRDQREFKTKKVPTINFKL